ncbi:MAG TPA: hypothetical protein VFC41_01080 [Anaerovoracaceae bacterium]|nr:hypothetical protein [Anaerovoracaceae bacterium]
MDLNDYEENDLFEDQFPEGNAPQGPENNGSNNRAFIVGIAALGGVVVLAIIAMIVYVLFFRPKTSADLQNQAAQIQAQNTAISLIATQTAEFNNSQATQKAAPTNTQIAPSATSVVAEATATTISDQERTSVASGSDPAARTATVAAFQTQAAAAALGTVFPGSTAMAQGTSTALPTTGFADEVGLPALVGAAIALIIIIFLARRMRFSNTN